MSGIGLRGDRLWSEYIEVGSGERGHLRTHTSQEPTLPTVPGPLSSSCPATITSNLSTSSEKSLTLLGLKLRRLGENVMKWNDEFTGEKSFLSPQRELSRLIICKDLIPSHPEHNPTIISFQTSWHDLPLHKTSLRPVWAWLSEVVEMVFDKRYQCQVWPGVGGVR